MPYILYKTNGSVLTTVDDASLDSSTDLSFVGRNYSGYGQTVNENFVKLLENFSNTSAPTKPVQGQIWFDSSNKTLKFSYNGKDFKELANIFVQGSAPNASELSIGDLWWDSSTAQLKVYDGSTFPVIGPISPSTSRAFWTPSTVATDFYVDSPILQASLDSNYVSVVSLRDFTPADPSDLYSSGFTTVKAGISLPGAQRDGEGTQPGSTEAAGYFFWGTAAHSRYSNTATHALLADNSLLAATATNVITVTQTTDQNYYVPFVSATSGTNQLTTTGTFYINAGILHATATAAQYADIAERYEADAIYEPGTVLMLGGEKEVTIACYAATTAVAGIVSKNPAYMLNFDAGTDETHPYIALKGRIPCKIVGPVKKGDLLVASGYKPGYAVKKQDHDSSDAVIGKALENFEGSFGVIEVKV